jgi:hypothetical protein
MKPGLCCWRLLLVLAMLVSGCSAPNILLSAQATNQLTSVEVGPASALPVIPEQRQILIDWPASIREKDDDWVVLSLEIDPSGQVTSSAGEGHQLPNGAPAIYETHNVVAVARLEMAGLNAWHEPVREPMRPGRPVRFRWAIRAEDAGVYRGVLWLALEFVPLTGGQVQSMIILSRPLAIEAITILGMPGWVGRVIGGVGLALSSLWGFSLVQPRVANAWRRRRNAAETKRSRGD